RGPARRAHPPRRRLDRARDRPPQPPGARRRLRRDRPRRRRPAPAARRLRHGHRLRARLVHRRPRAARRLRHRDRSRDVPVPAHHRHARARHRAADRGGERRRPQLVRRSPAQSRPHPARPARLAGRRQPRMPMKHLLAAVVAVACATPHAQRYSRQAAQHSLSTLADAGVVVGEFTLTRVVDGDTVRVDGLDSSLRLIGIDTEEIFHHEVDRRAVEADWHAYLTAKRGDSHHPVKLSTPMGEEAKRFAQQFFTIGGKVRIERDDPRQIRDRYDRYLAYVMVEKDGQWRTYNVEAVRAGMSPYFMKYGWSRRFDAELKAAEAEAKAAHRGIWSDRTMHYPDYDERAVWWTARAEFVAAFQKDAAARRDLIDL